MTTSVEAQFPYSETINEVERFLKNEPSFQTVLILADLITNLGVVANEPLVATVNDFVNQHYSRLSREPLSDSQNGYHFRLPLIFAMVATGSPIADYKSYFETEFKSQFLSVRFKAAKFCFENDYLREEATAILQSFVDSGAGNTYFSSAEAVLSECEATNDISKENSPLTILNGPSKRYSFKDEQSFLSYLSYADISEAPELFRQREFVSAEEKFNLILGRLKTLYLEDLYEERPIVVDVYRSATHLLAMQVSELGVSMIPILISEISNEHYDLVRAFFFKCLSFFEPSEVENSFAELGGLFVSQEVVKSSIPLFVSFLFRGYGVYAAPFLLECLKNATSPFEQNHILRTLSGILED